MSKTYFDKNPSIRSGVVRGEPDAIGIPWRCRNNAGFPVPFDTAFSNKDWVALTPIGGLDQAKLASEPYKYDEIGRPVERQVWIDRKYVSPYDLVAIGDDPALLCSERLVRALEALNVSGWSAKQISHGTPNPVCGRRVYWLTTSGWTGPVVDTEYEKYTWTPDPSPDPVRTPNRIPILPISFDATQWSGHAVCWSPWFGIGKSGWRALVVSGEVVHRLLEELPDLVCGIQRVTMRGARTPLSLEAGSVQAPEDSPPSTVSLDQLMDGIAAGAEQYDHTLFPGATEEDIADAARQTSHRLPADYLTFMRRWNGAELFMNTGWAPALHIWPIGPKGFLVSEFPPIRAMECHLFEEGDFPFACDPQYNVIWVLTLEGRVIGLGKEGIVYGPDVPFATWLGDMVADIAYARNMPDTLVRTRLLGARM